MFSFKTATKKVIQKTVEANWIILFEIVPIINLMWKGVVAYFLSIL